jgi:hypothetical protein
MTNHNMFFHNMPAIHHISEITDPTNYHDIPDDWYIALTDVRGSTVAIENGKYKSVNAVAAASITALINHIPEIDIPFVFGGDGATILIPPSILKEAGESLLATRDLAKQQFGLELRVGIVPVRDVLSAGFAIRVAKLRMSDNFQQAIVTGGGLTHAEYLLKDPEQGEKYAIPYAETYEADFSGFECRWNKIRSAHDETISLMIKATEGDSARHNEIYDEALAAIEQIYGDTLTRHPIRVENLKLNFLPSAFKTESAIRNQDTSFRTLLSLAWLTFKGRIAIWFNIKNFGAYKQILVEATDNEKFDDTLRMIISGSSQQREQLRAFLEEKRLWGQLVYGTHTSPFTLMTCIVFNHFGKQVHFVDGADGGYALAAKEMKEQLARRISGS